MCTGRADGLTSAVHLWLGVLALLLRTLTTRLYRLSTPQHGARREGATSDQGDGRQDRDHGYRLPGRRVAGVGSRQRGELLARERIELLMPPIRRELPNSADNTGGLVPPLENRE
jgi:hypothetical protein